MSTAEVVVLYAIASVVFSNGVLSAFLLLSVYRRRHEGSTRSSDTDPRTSAPSLTKAEPSVAVVRPVHGVGPGSRANNESLVREAATLGVSPTSGVVFVATDPKDEGLRLVKRDYPNVRRLVARELDCATDKASSMIQAWETVRADIVIFSDADVCVPAGSLRDIRQAFGDPEVAAVFCPVVNVPQGAWQHHLMATITNGDKIISVFGLDEIDYLNVMEGGLMAVRRSFIDQLGPVDKILCDTVADDLALATSVVQVGGVIRAAVPIVHRQSWSGYRDWARQYHRWMVCQRTERPGLLLIQLLLHPIIVPVIALGWLQGHNTPIFPLLVASVAWRVLVSVLTDRLVLRTYGHSLGAWTLLRPVADLVHATFCVVALLYPKVRWGNRTYRFPMRKRIVQRGIGREGSTT